MKYCRIMEDIVEIFIAGAKRVAKIKGCSQASIAKGTSGVAGLKGSQGTISSYFVGRTRPKPEVMYAISDFLGIPYKEILDIGRQELTKKTNPTLNEDEIRRIIREERKSEQLPTDITTERHRKLLESFRQKDLAFEINQLLVEIEDIDMETLKDAIPVLSLLKIQAEKKAAKKSAAASGEG